MSMSQILYSKFRNTFSSFIFSWASRQARWIPLQKYPFSLRAKGKFISFVYQLVPSWRIPNSPSTLGKCQHCRTRDSRYEVPFKYCSLLFYSHITPFLKVIYKPQLPTSHNGLFYNPDSTSGTALYPLILLVFLQLFQVSSVCFSAQIVGMLRAWKEASHLPEPPQLWGTAAVPVWEYLWDWRVGCRLGLGGNREYSTQGSVFGELQGFPCSVCLRIYFIFP